MAGVGYVPERYLGDIVEVIDPKDSNFEREGPITGFGGIDDTVPEGHVEVWFEDHKKHYPEDSIRSKPNRNDNWPELPNVPLRPVNT